MPARPLSARSGVWLAVVGLLASGPSGPGAFGQNATPVVAQTPGVAGAVAKPIPKPPAKRPAPVSANGCGSEGAIGVARTQIIDTTTGPRYGHQQFKDIDFLNDGEVVLTFDDGPLRPYTMPVLKALDAHCTKATFFIVGRMAIADPALVRETAKRGHTIGTHTWSHMDLAKTNPTRARGEMELGFSAVSKALGQPAAPFFRFPYLSSPKSMQDHARNRRFGVFSIEVDSNDYRTKDPAAVHKAVMAQLLDKKKGIILFHDIQPSTAGALQGLLDDLKARGFKVVHIAASAPVATLPEFDAIAEKELSRKSALAAADPLANRSMVWPMAGGSGGPKSVVPAVPGTEPDEMLPWGVLATKPSPPATPTARPKPAPAPSADLDWADKFFKF